MTNEYRHIYGYEGCAAPSAYRINIDRITWIQAV